MHVMSYSSAKQTDLALSVSTTFRTCERCLDAGCRDGWGVGWSWHPGVGFLQLPPTSLVCGCVFPVAGVNLWLPGQTNSVILTWKKCRLIENKRMGGLKMSIYIQFANLAFCGFTPVCYVTPVSPIYSF